MPTLIAATWSRMGEAASLPAAISWATASCAATKAPVMAAVRAHFKPEFLNRLDDIVMFDALTTEDLAHIVDLQVQSMQKRLSDRDLVERTTRQNANWLAAGIGGAVSFFVLIEVNRMHQATSF